MPTTIASVRATVLWRAFRTTLPVFALLPGSSIGSDAKLLAVDDGYTVSQRYYGNIGQYPELVWPELQFDAGQRVLPDRRYKKIGDRELHLDIYPSVEDVNNRQAIVLVHGGGWRSGNKSHFAPMAVRLAQRGYTVFTPEYRLSTEAQYPAGLVDLNDAIAWVRANAAEFGFDSHRIAIGGGSSGGQMAALLAYTADEPWFKTLPDDDTRVNALIDLDGVLDFMTPLAIRYENRLGDESAAGLWLGGAMEKVPEKWQQASPVRHVDAASPPTLIISSGQLRFTAGKDEVVEKLAEHGIHSDYIEFDEVIHTFWLFDPYLEKVVDAMDCFLQKAGR